MNFRKIPIPLNKNTVLTARNVHEFINHQPDIDTTLDILKNPKIEMAAVMEILRYPRTYLEISGLLRNPNLPPEIPELIALNRDNLWDFSSAQLGFNVLYWDFISTLNPREPFPALLTDISTPGHASAYLITAGTALTDDLWHDLASRDLLDLQYERDSFDGDSFGPLFDPRFDEVGLGMPGQRVLSSGFNVDWIEQVPVADVDHIHGNLEYRVEDYWDDDAYGDLETGEKDRFVQAMAAETGIQNGHLTFREDRLAEYEKFLVLAVLEEEDDELLDYEATVQSVPGNLIGPRYAELDPYMQVAFASVIILAHQDEPTQKDMIARHFAKLMVLHPQTDTEVKQLLIESDIPDIESDLARGR